MTREEAIKAISDMILDMEYPNGVYHEKFTEDESQKHLALYAVKKALRPVSREQVEKVWRGCSFCKNDGVQDYRTAVCVTRWGMSYLKGPEIESDDIFYAQNHFCRFCGRPLTLEAWKEMRKRWEAANDAD